MERLRAELVVTDVLDQSNLHQHLQTLAGLEGRGPASETLAGWRKVAVEGASSHGCEVELIGDRTLWVWGIFAQTDAFGQWCVERCGQDVYLVDPISYDVMTTPEEVAVNYAVDDDEELVSDVPLELVGVEFDGLGRLLESRVPPLVPLRISPDWHTGRRVWRLPHGRAEIRVFVGAEGQDLRFGVVVANTSALERWVQKWDAGDRVPVESLDVGDVAHPSESREQMGVWFDAQVRLKPGVHEYVCTQVLETLDEFLRDPRWA